MMTYQKFDFALNFSPPRTFLTLYSSNQTETCIGVGHVNFAAAPKCLISCVLKWRWTLHGMQRGPSTITTIVRTIKKIGQVKKWQKPWETASKHEKESAKMSRIFFARSSVTPYVFLFNCLQSFLVFFEENSLFCFAAWRMPLRERKHFSFQCFIYNDQKP